MAVQVDYRIAPSDQFSVYNPDTKSNKTITYFTLLAKIRGDLNISNNQLNVDISNPQDNQLLVYDSASSSWKNESVSIFKTIAVSGQDSVSADSLEDTLTLVAGTGITIQTDEALDKITISSSGAGGTLDATGIITGGVLSASIGGTTFSVSAGAGQIITYSAGATSVSASVQNVTWSAFNNVAITNIASQPFTYIYIDSSGNLVQQATPFTDDQYKEYIIIGHLCHIDLATINLVTNDQNVSYGTAHRLLELIQTFGPIKKTGLSVGANGSNLSVNRTSGEGYIIGSNYSSDQFEPDRISLSAKSPALLCRMYRDGSGGYVFDNNSGSYYNYVDPTKWDDGTGTLNVVNNNQWTVQRLYTFPSAPDDIICYYGIDFYNSQGDALANMMYEPFAEAEITLLNSIFLGYLIVRGGATNLSNLGDATFIQSGLFRGLGTGGGSTTNLRLEDLSDVAISSIADNQFLLYDSTTSTWKNESVGIFNTIAVSGQTDIVADSYTDTLTLVAGTNITITTDATNDTITINSPDAGGTVTSIETTAPIQGGTITTSGTISITQSGLSTDGYLSSTDWNTFNDKEPALTKGNLTETTSSILTISGGTNAVIGSGTTIAVSQADASTSGYLSSTDWNTFNDKEPALTKGNLTEATSSILTISNGTGAVIGAGTSIQVTQSSATTSGYLSSTDWSTFSGKADNSFTTIAVPTQTDIVADSPTDTLTFAAGSGVTIATDAITDTITISATGSGGTVTSVATSAPLSGGPITGSGTISITQSTTSTDGYLSSTDWNTFNGKEPALTKGNLTEATSAILTITGGTNAVIGSGTSIQVSQATTTTSGYLSSTDWNTFNDKEPALTKGNLTETTSSVLTIGSGTGAVIGSGTTITVSQSGILTSGYLSSTDWNTFNGKQDALTLGNLTETTSSILSITGGTNSIIGSGVTIAVSQATTSTSGYLSSTDWNTFNDKEPALTKGNLTEATSAILTITGGTNSVIGSGTTIEVSQASTSTNGYLSSADWNTFNDKEPAVTKGNLTEATSSVLTITGGTNAVIGSGTTIAVAQAGSTTSGYLSSTDWGTFDGKADYSFVTIAVSGQTDVVADSASDTLTLVAGTGVTITTDAAGDSVTISTAGIVDGSGTTNYVAKWTDTDTIGDSQIFDNGTNVGIGTALPAHKVDVDGGVYADYFQLDTSYSDGAIAGKFSWNPDRETAELGLDGTVSLILGQDNLWYVKNQTGSAIPKGRAVMAVGALGASSRILVAPMVADGTISPKYLIGVTIEEIANGDDGFAVSQGKLRGFNTSGYTAGTVLYCDPNNAGQFTSTEPTAPHLKLPIAFAIDSKNNGTLAIRVTAGTTIGEANDVELTSVADNDFLVYNSTSGAWENEAIGIFKTIAVSGQDDVIADAYNDTLTFVAGSNITITTDATNDTITIDSPDGGGTVTSIATSAPLSGGPITSTGTISITQSDASTDGYLSSTDWSTFNGKQNALTFGNLTETTSSILTITGGTGAVVGSGTTIAVTQASASTSGFLSSADWNTFNDKEPTVTKGNLTEATSSVLTITNGTGAVIGSGTSIQVSQSSSSTSGYLSSADWTTFNGKASYAFKTISVSGQSDIVADAADDTLTVAEGARIDITTDATADTLTITHGTASGADFTTAQDFKDRVEADGGIFEAIGEVAVALGILEDSLPATASDNSDGVVLQNIAVDEFGHVLGYSSIDLDDRYYTETEVDALFALETLDTVTDRGATTTNSITIGGLTVDTSTLVVDSANNRVVIGGTSASYPLHVKTQVSNVSIYADYDIAAYSDARVKEDVITISGALEKVRSMRGVTYKRIGLESDKRFMGVIAQEVLPHAPEVVHQDEDGMYSVSYQNMVGLLIEAMKEQQQQIDELKEQLNKYLK